MVEQSVSQSPAVTNLNNAIRWYWLHKERIVAEMPIVCSGLTYHADYLKSLERAIAQHQSGKSSLFLSTAYIVCPLRRIKSAIARQ